MAKYKLIVIRSSGAIFTTEFDGFEAEVWADKAYHAWREFVDKLDSGSAIYDPTAKYYGSEKVISLHLIHSPDTPEASIRARWPLRVYDDMPDEDES